MCNFAKYVNLFDSSGPILGGVASGIPPPNTTYLWFGIVNQIT